MKYLLLCLAVLCICQITSPLNAQLYSWTDEKGVKHFSNDPPPDQQAEEVDRIPEIPYDAVSDAVETKKDEAWQQKKEQEYEEQLKQSEEKTGAAPGPTPESPDIPKETEPETVVEEVYHGPVYVNPGDKVLGVQEPSRPESPRSERPHIDHRRVR